MSEAISEVVERVVRALTNAARSGTGLRLTWDEVPALLNYIKARPSREEVARAINPDAWAHVDGCRAAAEQYPESREELLKVAAERIADDGALEAADRVLSLFSSEDLVSSSRDRAPAISSALEKAVTICEEQEAAFLSPEYATGQPDSSFSERFACRSCAQAIRDYAGTLSSQTQVVSESSRNANKTSQPDHAPGECPECHKYVGKCPYCHRKRPLPQPQTEGGAA